MRGHSRPASWKGRNNSMKKSSIVALSIVGVLVILIVGVVGWGISANNRFVELEETAASAKSDIDTVLQRRADLIPNLVATVKGYAQHEEEVINAVSDARAKLAGASTTEDKLAANDELSSALSRLLVVVENYPDLKASQNFIDLQTQLEGTENRIARSRQEYNDAVQEYNAAIRKFPGSLIAGMQGFEKMEFFEAADGTDTPPTVDFD